MNAKQLLSLLILVNASAAFCADDAPLKGKPFSQAAWDAADPDGTKFGYDLAGHRQIIVKDLSKPADHYVLKFTKDQTGLKNIKKQLEAQGADPRFLKVYSDAYGRSAFESDDEDDSLYAQPQSITTSSHPAFKLDQKGRMSVDFKIVGFNDDGTYQVSFPEFPVLNGAYTAARLKNETLMRP